MNSDLDRHDNAARLILLGLHKHYRECIESGRLDVWARAGHAAIDLLSLPPDSVTEASSRDPSTEPKDNKP